MKGTVYSLPVIAVPDCNMATTCPPRPSHVISSDSPRALLTVVAFETLLLIFD